MGAHPKVWCLKAAVLLVSVALHWRISLAAENTDGWANKSELQSYMRCTGTSVHDRACYFRDVIFDITSGDFLFYGSAFHKRALAPDDAQSDEKTDVPWLQLSRLKWTQEGSEKRFRLNWITNGSSPAQSETCRVRYPVHLRSPHRPSSFGHLLRDNFEGLVEITQKLNRVPHTYTWVRWPSDSSHVRGVDSPTGAMKHYFSWVSETASQSWNDVLDGCSSQSNDTKSKPRYVRFDDMVAGYGGIDFIEAFKPGDDGLPSQLRGLPCTHDRWMMMRDTAYGIARVKHVPAAQQKARVLFLEHLPDERRAVLNMPEVLDALHQRFADINVDSIPMSTMSADQQLRELSSTTILISNVGSASFRMVYLPTGAQVILIGSPTKAQSNDTEVELTPFKEADACWAHLGYINIWQYFVGQGEFTLAAGRDSLLDESGIPTHQYHFYRAWDADVTLDAQRIGDLIQLAMDQMRD